MPDVPSAGRAAPVGELDAIPIISHSPAPHAALGDSATDAPADLLCKKGTASASRSRARAYDHKDAFEPAQRPSAPLPDIEEPLASWYKYDGSPPVPEAEAKSASDEELATSWYKYETRPVASLFPPIEPPPAKAPVRLTDAAPEAARPLPAARLDPAVTPSTERAAATPEQPTEIETAAVPSSSEATDARLELPPAGPATVDVQSVGAEPLSAEASLPPESGSEGPTEIAAAARDATVADATAAEFLESPPPGPKPALSALISTAPEEQTAAQTDPMPLELPDEPEAQAVEPPVFQAQPDIATGDTPVEPATQSQPTPSWPTFVPAIRAFEVPEEQVHSRDKHGRDDIAESWDQRRPSGAFERSESAGDASIEAAAPPPTDVALAAEQFAPATAERLPALPAATGEPPSIAQPVEPQVLVPLAATAAEQTEPALEAPAQAGASRVEPQDRPETSSVAVAAKPPRPAKKAMLARLAVLLERMLSVKQSENTPEKPAEAAEPEVPELTPPPAEASDASPFEEPLLSEPAASLLETETPIEAAEPVAWESDTDVVVAAAEETIDHARHQDAVDPETAAADASPVEPPTEPEAVLALRAPASEVRTASPEISHHELSAELEGAVPEPAPADMVPTTPFLDLDSPAPEPTAPAEPFELPTPVSATQDAIAAGSAEPAPEVEPSFVSPPTHPDLAQAASDMAPLAQLEMAGTEFSQEPRAEEPDVPSSAPIMLGMPLAGPAPDIAADPPLQALAEVAMEAPDSAFPEAMDPPPEAHSIVAPAHVAGADALADEFPAPDLWTEPEAEPAEPGFEPAAEADVSLQESTVLSEDDPPSLLPEERPRPIEEPSIVTHPHVASTDATLEALPSLEPANEAQVGGRVPAPEKPAETEVLSQAQPVADIEPPTLPVHESPGAIDEPAPSALSVENDAQASTTVEAAASPDEPLLEQPVEAAAPIDAAAICATPAEERSFEPIPPAVATSADRVDEERAARAALVSNLADVIHDVLSTTKFATKATMQGRYSSNPRANESEPGELSGALAEGALPHPVAIRSRLGRTERAIAFASVGMMIAAGYFAFSLWRDESSIAVQAPATAVAPWSDAWGERARGVTHEAVVDTPKTLNATPKTSGAKSADAQRLRGPQLAQ